MTDLKGDFYNWLVKQGLSEKTRTGRPGTVYEYIRHIDKVCDMVQSKHDNDAWLWLADHIFPILGFYIICKNGSVRIDNTNRDRFKDFLFTLTSCYQYNQTPFVQKFFLIKYLYQNEEEVAVFRFENMFLLENLGTDGYELTLQLNVPQSIAKNDRKALQKFYDFLSTEKYDPVNQTYLFNTNPKTRKDIQDKLDGHYSLISINLKGFACENNPNCKILSFTPDSTYFSLPPEFPTRINEKYLSGKEVMALFTISDWTLRHLKSPVLKEKGLPQLFPEPDGRYSITNVNGYINKCFHKSMETKIPPNIDNICNWWTADEIHEKFGISSQRIGQLRKKVAYLRIGEGKYLYNPYEFKKPWRKSIRIHAKNRKMKLRKKK